MMEKEARRRSPKPLKSLTKRQWQLLFNAAGIWSCRQMADITLLILSTRLSPTALAQVKWSDVDLSEHRLRITDPTGHTFWHEIGPTARGILGAWHDLGLDSGYILGKAPQQALARINRQLHAYFQTNGHPGINLDVVYFTAMENEPKAVAANPAATDQLRNFEITEPIRWLM